MMFVNESIDIPRLIGNDILQFLVHSRAAMLHLVQYGVQNNDVFQDILFEYIDLIEHHICVQHQIVPVRKIGIR